MVPQCLYRFCCRCMRRVMPAVCVGTLLLGTAAHGERKAKPAKEGRRADTRQIEGMEQQWRNAVMQGDASALEKLLSDDFLAISARGTLSDKQQYLQRIAAHTTQFSTFELMDMKVRLQPGSAVAVSQAHIEGMLEGRPIQGTFRYTKVYARVPGGPWRMTNFEATRVSAPAAGTGDMNQGAPLTGRPIPPTNP